MVIADRLRAVLSRQAPDMRDATVFEHSQRMIFIKTRGKRTLAGEASLCAIFRDFGDA